MTKQEYSLKLEEKQRRNEELSKKYVNGASMREIAEECGLTVTYIRSILVRMGTYKAKPRRKNAEIQEIDEVLTFKELKYRITSFFPVGKVFRIKEFRLLCNTKVFVKYRYFIVKNHSSYCIQLSELTREETENGIEYIEKGKHRQTSPSYAGLYLMLKNGVRTID